MGITAHSKLVSAIARGIHAQGGGMLGKHCEFFVKLPDPVKVEAIWKGVPIGGDFERFFMEVFFEFRL